MILMEQQKSRAQATPVASRVGLFLGLSAELLKVAIIFTLW
jgi:hypothetical protein